MTKPGKKRRRTPQTDKPQTPFWVAAVKQHRPRRITDVTPLPKGAARV